MKDQCVEEEQVHFDCDSNTRSISTIRQESALAQTPGVDSGVPGNPSTPSVSISSEMNGVE